MSTETKKNDTLLTPSISKQNDNNNKLSNATTTSSLILLSDEEQKKNNKNPLVRDYDKWLVFGLTSILGLSIGFGESKANFATAAKEFGFVFIGIGVMALTALVYYAIRKRYFTNDANKLSEEDRKSRKRYLAFLGFSALGLTLGFIPGALTVHLVNNAAILDQGYSQKVAKWMRNGWFGQMLGAKNPMAFQALSYQFGYKLLAGLIALTIAIVAYKMIFLKKGKKDNGWQKIPKWARAILPGLILAGCIYGSNFVIHAGAAMVAASMRPIMGTQWEKMVLSGNWWAQIDSLGGVTNPGIKDGSKNWYSGHTSWVATAFWLSLFVTIYYFRTTDKQKRTTWKSIDAVAMTTALFGLTFLTAACRVGGLAHTMNAVISGSIMPMFTVAIGIALFLGVKKLMSYLPKCSAALFPSNTKNDESENNNIEVNDELHHSLLSPQIIKLTE